MFNEYKEFFHSASQPRDIIASSIAAEPFKTTYRERGCKNLSFEFEDKIHSQEFKLSGCDGILGTLIKIELPQIICIDDYKVKWKNNLYSLLIKKAKAYLNEVPIAEITGSYIRAYNENLTMHMQEKALTKLNENLTISLPFWFNERPSKFLQTFRCPDKIFKLTIELETDLENLLDIYECSFQEDGEERSETLIPFTEECFEALGEISLSESIYDIYTSISVDDKNDLTQNRNIEIVPIIEEDCLIICDKNNTFELVDETSTDKNIVMDNFYAFMWIVDANKNPVNSRLKLDKHTDIFNVSRDITRYWWPLQQLRKVSDQEIHVWANCDYICDPGPKPCRHFPVTSKLLLEFPPDTKGCVTLIKFSQCAYMWKDNGLKVLTF